MPVDPDAYRKASRERWNGSAAGWAVRRQAFNAAAMPVTLAMVEGIAPQPGHALLELAAGLGDVGFMALELAQPGGTLICSDFAPEMLTAAQARATELGLRTPTDVRFRQIDAESVDLPTGSLDGVLCRWGYMLMADPAAALRETRRTLKPGGRVALAAWTGPEENGWSALPGRELARRGLKEPVQPDEPGQFAWADPERIAAALQDAGFAEAVGIERVAFALRYPDFDTWWAAQRDLSSTFAQTVDALDPATREEVRTATREAAAEHVADDGSVAIPAATWVAVAEA